MTFSILLLGEKEAFWFGFVYFLLVCYLAWDCSWWECRKKWLVRKEMVYYRLVKCCLSGLAQGWLLRLLVLCGGAGFWGKELYFLDVKGGRV